MTEEWDWNNKKRKWRPTSVGRLFKLQKKKVRGCPGAGLSKTGPGQPSFLTSTLHVASFVSGFRVLAVSVP